MYKRYRIALLLIIALACITSTQAATDADWAALAGYQYGQDFKPLLDIERELIGSINDPAKRQACTERLAGLLSDAKTTLPAKQFICYQLQVLGTPKQVSLLAKMLDDAKTAEMARMTLEKIRGDESLAVLRGGLKKYDGKLLLGLIDSVATRRDAASVDTLKKLADGKNAEVAGAALWGLASIGGPVAAEVVSQKIAQADKPIPARLAAAYLRCAESLSKAGKTDATEDIYARLSKPDVAKPNREAALQCILDAAGDKTVATTIAWLGDDELKRTIAAGQLNSLTDAASTKALIEAVPKLPTAAKVIVLKSLSGRYDKAVLPAVVAAAKSDDGALRLAAVECLAKVGGAAEVQLLVDELSRPAPLAQAAALSLATMSGKTVDLAILAAMEKADGAARSALTDVLCRRESTVAVPVLLAEASEKDAARHGPAIEGLRGLASEKNVPAMIAILAKTPKGKHRDEIEKTILLVCNKTKDPKRRAAPVLAVLAKADEASKCLLLPVAGRLGGADSFKAVEAAIKSGNPKLQDAGVRALCNWPDNSVAERLLAMVKQTKNKQHRTWALRAYIRVITLESKRSPAQTLAMLQTAMKLAQADSQRQLVLQRAATVRTMETLRWVVPYLDDPALNQAACETIADLAHHRFLRNPNKEEFAKALKKVTKISKDPKVVERAQRYILGI